jgi:hypothetical protein
MKKLIVFLSCLSIAYAKVGECKPILPQNGRRSAYCTKFAVGKDHTIKAKVQMQVPGSMSLNRNPNNPDGEMHFQVGIFNERTFKDMNNWGDLDRNRCKDRQKRALALADVTV